MRFNHVALFLKPGAEKAQELARQIEKTLHVKGLEVTEHNPHHSCPVLPSGALALVLGGDGTFLAATRCLHNTHIPITGINLGNLGFLTELTADEMAPQLENLIAGQAEEEKRHYGLFTLDKTSSPDPFVNDMVIQRLAQDKLLQFEIFVGHKKMADLKADGVIISTPTGSTAYNMSSGGPIVHPTLDSWVITPLGAHTLSFRPVVVPMTDVTIKLNSPRAYCTADGQDGTTLQTGSELKVQRASNPYTVLHPGGRNFYALLQQKLGWIR